MLLINTTILIGGLQRKVRSGDKIMSKSVKSAMHNNVLWTIGNKRLKISSLKGERFREWFNQKFNLS